MSEVKRFKPVINNKPYTPYAYCEENSEGIYVRIDDYDALKAERDALAVECAQYKSLAERFAERADDYKSEHFGYSVFDSSNEFKQHIKTPATDAYLNSARADVIKDFCQLLGQYGKVEPHHFNADFADLYAKINKEIYESILDNPAVYDIESLVDWLERGVNDSRAYAHMSSQHTSQLRAGEPS